MLRRPSRLLFCCLTVWLLLSGTSSAWAWNGSGHRLVATMAWRYLTPESRQQIAGLLARHGDYNRWIARDTQSATAHTAFIEASTWPDDIRRDPRFHDDHDTPTPDLPGFPDMARHGHWHYVDLADNGQNRLSRGEIDQQLPHLARLLADPRQAVALRCYALPWLIHLVADLHQPLHVGNRFDEGGNRYPVIDPQRPQREQNLHSWWDELPGPAGLRGSRLEARADVLLAQHPEDADGDVAQWLKESHQLAQNRAYPDKGIGPTTLSPAFIQASQTIADRRLVQAGKRLARLLNALLERVPRETAKPGKSP